jgi:predicted metal-dependent hydrolase
VSADTKVGGRSCADPPPPELRAAVEEFNRGEFFECHETLEALWLAEAEPLRRLYQGILQVGVAFHHQRRGNYRGTMHLLTSGIGYLLPFAPRCLGVDVEGLLEAAVRCRDTLAALGPARIGELDRTLIPRLTLVDQPRPDDGGAPPY